MNEMVKRLMFRKKRSGDLVLGLRQDLQKLGYSGDTQRQILALVLNRVNKYLEDEGVDPLAISGIPGSLFLAMLKTDTA